MSRAWTQIKKVFLCLALFAILAFLGNGCQKSSPGTTEIPAPASAATCNNVSGLTAPISTCSSSNICTHLSGELIDAGVTSISSPTQIPNCFTTNTSQRTYYNDAPAISIAGIDGTTRYVCVFKPAGTGLRPLVVWFHPGGNGTADLVYDQTNLRKKAINFDLGGTATGFVLASVQGRALEYPMAEPRDGNHHDFFYRSLDSPSLNPDIRLTDDLIDRLVSEGGIDTSRIYVMGWSNGAMFAQLYAIARKSKATPGGNTIRSAAVYSGGDPFHNVNSETESPSCRLNPYPVSNVPIYIVRRSCDGALACNSLQQSWFATPPGHDTETWKTLASSLGYNITVTTIDGRGASVSGCKQTIEDCSTDSYGISAVSGCSSPIPAQNVAYCANAAATTNHLRWPDGILDNSGNDYEALMLGFLKNH